MIEKMNECAAGTTGLTVSGTVVSRDVNEAVRMLAPVDRLLVQVAPRFDGYMAELVGGMHRACREGQAKRCALVVPEDMASEATMQGEGAGFRVFTTRSDAENWLSA